MLISDPSNLKEAERRALLEMEAMHEMIDGRDKDIARLRQALTAVVDNILDYERVNNLSPLPGRKYCWDTVARAQDILGR